MGGKFFQVVLWTQTIYEALEKLPLNRVTSYLILFLLSPMVNWGKKNPVFRSNFLILFLCHYMAQRYCSGPSLSQALFFSQHSCANFPCLQTHHYMFSLSLLPFFSFDALSSTFNSMGLHNIHSSNHSLINTSNYGAQKLTERTQNLY